MKKVDIEKFEDFDLSKISEIVLSLTNFCNMACKYCFAVSTGEERRRKNLDFNKIKILLETFSKYTKPGLRVALLGSGEPTLHPRILDIIDLINELFVDPKIAILTGGLLSIKRVDEFLERGVVMLITFGGTPEIQDEERPFRNSKNKTSEVVVKVMKRIIEVNPDKLVVNLDYSVAKFGKEEEIIDFLESLGVKRVKLSVITLGGKGAEYLTKFTPFTEVKPTIPPGLLETEQDFIKFGKWFNGLKNIEPEHQKALWDLVVESYKRSAKFGKMIQDRGMDFGDSFTALRKHCKFPSCGGGTTSITITPDGTITPCVGMAADWVFYCNFSLWEGRKNLMLGEIDDDGVKIFEERFKKAREFIQAVPEQCKSCSVKQYCSGCFPYKGEYKGKYFFLPTFCARTHERVEQQLKLGCKLVD